MPSEEVKSKLNTFLISGILFLLILSVIVLASNKLIETHFEKYRDEQHIEVRGRHLLPEASHVFAEFLVSGTDRSIIKCRIEIQLSSQAMLRDIYERKAEIRDIVSRVLASYDAEQANRDYINRELHLRIINAINRQFRDWFVTGGGFWQDNEVKKVLDLHFSEFYAR